jgi:predicted phosphodiesterase
MRVAALYDIHGNLPALEAVLHDVRRAGVDRVVVGGDVMPGPMPRESLRCLLDLDLPVQFIHGNGDREVLALMRGVETGAVPEPFREVMRWSARQFSSDDEQLIAAWPATLRVEIGALGEVLFCHATPRNDTEVFTRLTPDDRLLPIFCALDVRLVVCGHTHMQFDRTVGHGMPFGEPGAFWLLLGPDVELRHTAFDLENAAERIRGTGYPQAAEFATGNVLQPPSEREVLEALSRAELK